MRINRKTERKIIAVLAVFFCFMMILCLAEGSRAEDDEITLQAECGYDGYGKFGRNIPFFAEITSTESFQGVLRIIVPANNGEGNYAYEYPLSVEKDVPFSIRGEVPLISNYTTISFQVLSEKSRILTRQEVQVRTGGREVTELYVGVMSENPDAAQAFQSVNLGEYTDSSFPYVKTRAFVLEQEDIADIKYGLDCLDVIVLDRMASDSLTDVQKEVLNSWVCDGGSLVAEIGSGEYIFPTADYPVTDEIEVRPYLWVQTQTMKNGKTGYFNLRVADMDLMEFAVDNNAIPGSVISKVCSAEVITQIIENDHYYDGEETYQSIKELLDTAMGRKLPRISVYVLLMLIYLMLAGPVVYYMLKKRDKAGLTGTAVTGLAVLFSVLIYLMGTSTRFQEPVIRYATIWTVDGKTISEESYIDAKAPTSSPYQLQIKPEYAVYPISADSHYYYETVDKKSVWNDYKIELYNGEKSTSITMSQSAPFESQYFRLEREIENKSLLGLGADLKYFNETLRGEVYNETQKNFEDVILILRNGIYKLGNIHSGEAVNIENAEKIYFYPDTCEAAASDVTGLTEVSYWIYSENQEYAVLSQKTGLLEYYLEQMNTGDGTRAVLLAFLGNGAAGDFQADGAYPVYGATLLNKMITLNTEANGLVYQNLSPEEIINIDDDISYHEDTGSTYSTSIRLQYNLGSIDQLRAVRFAEAEVEEDNPDYQAFSGEVYFYNPLTLAYELVDLSSRNFWITDLEKYLMGRDGAYSMIVQYSSEIIDTEQYREIILPLVSVIRKK